jgi:hypothetical protein
LLQISTAERRAFPATLGEYIGLTVSLPDGRISVMTEDGWQIQPRD